MFDFFNDRLSNCFKSTLAMLFSNQIFIRLHKIYGNQKYYELVAVLLGKTSDENMFYNVSMGKLES